MALQPAALGQTKPVGDDPHANPATQPAQRLHDTIQRTAQGDDRLKIEAIELQGMVTGQLADADKTFMLQMMGIDLPGIEALPEGVIRLFILRQHCGMGLQSHLGQHGQQGLVAREVKQGLIQIEQDPVIGVTAHLNVPACVSWEENGRRPAGPGSSEHQIR